MPDISLRSKRTDNRKPEPGAWNLTTENRIVTPREVYHEPVEWSYFLEWLPSLCLKSILSMVNCHMLIVINVAFSFYLA